MRIPCHLFPSVHLSRSLFLPSPPPFLSSLTTLWLPFPLSLISPKSSVSSLKASIFRSSSLSHILDFAIMEVESCEVVNSFYCIWFDKEYFLLKAWKCRRFYVIRLSTKMVLEGDFRRSGPWPKEWISSWKWL